MVPLKLREKGTLKKLSREEKNIYDSLFELMPRLILLLIIWHQQSKILIYDSFKSKVNLLPFMTCVSYDMYSAEAAVTEQ